MKKHEIKLQIKLEVKPKVKPKRTIPYYSQERANKIIEDMVKGNVIEIYPISKPVPWISDITISPKSNESVRITPYARNIKQHIHQTFQYQDRKT